MSESPTPDAPQQPAQAEGDSPAPEAPAEQPAKAETDWKAEARKWEQRAKDNSGAAEQLKKLQEAQMSDLEKAQREAQEARDVAEKATVDALRFRIASEAGIKENVDLILTAPDEETMRRQAELWSERAAAAAAPGTPKPDPSVGVKGGGPKSNGDVFASLISEHFTR